MLGSYRLPFFVGAAASLGGANPNPNPTPNLNPNPNPYPNPYPNPNQVELRTCGSSCPRRPPSSSAWPKR